MRDIKIICSLAIACCAILLLLLLTSRRNDLYLSEFTLLRDVIAKSPGKQRPHFNYGCTLSRMQLYKEALDQFTLCLDLPASDGFQTKDLFVEMGNAHYFLERYEEAVIKWRQALMLSPGDPEILNNMAMAMIKQGSLDDALRLAEMARHRASVELLPEVLLTMAQIKFLKKDVKSAEQFVWQALQSAPLIPSVYFSVATMYDDIGMPVDAVHYAKMYLQYEHDEIERQKAALLVQRLSE